MVNSVKVQIRKNQQQNYVEQIKTIKKKYNKQK